MTDKVSSVLVVFLQQPLYILWSEITDRSFEEDRIIKRSLYINTTKAMATTSTLGVGGVKRRQRHLHPGEEVAQSVGCKRDVGARFIDNSRRLKDVLDYVANGR
jgi:hypothetical protein